MKFQLADLAQLSSPLRLTVFVGTLLLLWLPFALPIYGLVDNPNTESLLSLPILYGLFIMLLRFWGQRVYRVPNLLWRYGLEFSRRSFQEWGLGIVLGSVSLALLFALEGLLGWVSWRSLPPLPIILEGFLIAVAFGFAEELFFRGWLLEELQRDYKPNVALWTSSIIYAVLHGFRLQLPALVLFGAALVWAKRVYGVEKQRQSNSLKAYRQGRLALPMGLHAGLVWAYYMLNVGNMMVYTGQVSDWLTGVERNPLAGLLGLGFMGGLVWCMRSLAHKSSVYVLLQHVFRRIMPGAYR